MRRSWLNKLILVTVFLLVTVNVVASRIAPVTLQQPTGNYALSTPAYTWTENMTGKVLYQLYVVDSLGAVQVNHNYTAASICASNTCSVVPAVPLTLGTGYCWNVRGKLADGTLDDWSPASCFKVVKPTTIAPSGLIVTQTPTFSWNPITGATKYQVYVIDGAANVFINELHTAAEVSCGKGELTCSFTSSSSLTDSTKYSWNVQGFNDGGNGPWSSALGFTVNTAGLPDKPVTSAPSGNITATKPSFMWTDTGDSTYYQIYVVNSSGVAVISENHAANSLCSSGSCSFTPGADLDNLTTYSWNVRGLNIAGAGPFSDALGFTVNTAGVPGTPTLTSPGNSDYPATVQIAKDLPVYSWNAVSGATKYQIYIADMTGGGEVVLDNRLLTPAEANCGSGEPGCSYISSAKLTMGRDISWSLRAFNISGNGPWGGPTLFTVVRPTSISPTGNTTSQSPAFSWDAIWGASSYELRISNAAGTVVHDAIYTSADGSCTTFPGTCSVTPPITLPDMTAYLWNIQGINSKGGGPWSNALGFTVNTVGLPGKPVTSAPSGNITATKPVFTWTDTGDSTYYQIYVVNSSAVVVINESHTASSLCSSGTCSFTPGADLADLTAYSWNVRGRNITGSGPWSDAKGFTINVSGIPGTPTAIAPSVSTDIATPTFSWNDLGNATQYQLYVTTNAGVPVRNTMYTVGAGGLSCDGTTCSITPGDVLSNGTNYNWNVRGKNMSGVGPWSVSTSFTVNLE